MDFLQSVLPRKNYWMNPPFTMGKNFLDKAMKLVMCGSNVVIVIPERSICCDFWDEVISYIGDEDVKGIIKFWECNETNGKSHVVISFLQPQQCDIIASKYADVYEGEYDETAECDEAQREEHVIEPPKFDEDLVFKYLVEFKETGIVSKKLKIRKQYVSQTKAKYLDELKVIWAQ
jgi:hypothetical protein